jgi:hypothetical protein
MGDAEEYDDYLPRNMTIDELYEKRVIHKDFFNGTHHSEQLSCIVLTFVVQIDFDDDFDDEDMD